MLIHRYGRVGLHGASSFPPTHTTIRDLPQTLRHQDHTATLLHADLINTIAPIILLHIPKCLVIAVCPALPKIVRASSARGVGHSIPEAHLKRSTFVGVIADVDEHIVASRPVACPGFKPQPAVGTQIVLDVEPGIEGDLLAHVAAETALFRCINAFGDASCSAHNVRCGRCHQCDESFSTVMPRLNEQLRSTNVEAVGGLVE